MNNFQLYTEDCVLCGKTKPKRDMNQISIAYGHTSVRAHKKMCSVCDDCLPDLCNYLGVKAPDNNVRWGKGGSLCYKCYKYSRQDALFCQYCGTKMRGKRKVSEDG